MMRAPRFWWRRPGLAARLLSPIGAAYGAIAARRMARGGESAGIPVLCVGNFVAGGAGKTPFAIEIAARLGRMGEQPVFLTRGHGGTAAGPLLVEAEGHAAGEVGDEPLLLARHAPTVVSRARPAGARLASEHGGVIVMDDGLQNPSLVKDFAFAVADGRLGVGNGFCLPAGPLRAPLSAQWDTVDALVVVGAGEQGDSLAREAGRRLKQVLRAEIVADEAAAKALRGRRVLAFAGIGHPEKFLATLRETGAVVTAEHAFADHHAFSTNELAALAGEARANSAVLVTTEKDMARIGRAYRHGGSAVELRALPISLRFESSEALDSLLAGVLAGRRGRAIP